MEGPLAIHRLNPANWRLSPRQIDAAAHSGRLLESVLYYFTGGTDGADLLAGLVFGLNGAPYGTTAFGGASNAGAVFEVTRKLTDPTSSRDCRVVRHPFGTASKLSAKSSAISVCGFMEKVTVFISGSCYRSKSHCLNGSEVDGGRDDWRARADKELETVL